MNQQTVTVTTAAGTWSPQLQGSWFREGFQGSMAELLCAIGQDREPNNSASDNLKILALCFAAVKSADTATPQAPGDVRRVE